MSQPPFDVKRANRWFAVEQNNLAWELIEADRRSPEQEALMIHAAHGACYHWLESGDLLNHLRAQQLLATAYTMTGDGPSAVRHARMCLALSEQAPADKLSPFDRACTHGSAAVAFQLAGDQNESNLQAQAFTAAFDSLTDEGDRNLIHKLYQKSLVD